MSNITRNLAPLQAAIDHIFSNAALLDEALTHRSFINEAEEKGVKDNERLEFFGDAVLDFALSHLLLERFPSSREGDLTRLRASLVDEERLALMAQRIDLGRYLRLGRGEERSGGREKKSILADAYEALLAAVYLDGGIAPVRRLIEIQLDYLLVSVNASVGHDWKTEFQEFIQRQRGLTPHYVLQATSGPDHDRIFSVCAFAGSECMGVGEGKSKKEAEQAAARISLEALRGAGSRPQS